MVPLSHTHIYVFRHLFPRLFISRDKCLRISQGMCADLCMHMLSGPPPVAVARTNVRAVVGKHSRYFGQTFRTLARWRAGRLFATDNATRRRDVVRGACKLTASQQLRYTACIQTGTPRHRKNTSGITPHPQAHRPHQSPRERTRHKHIHYLPQHSLHRSADRILTTVSSQL